MMKIHEYYNIYINDIGETEEELIGLVLDSFRLGLKSQDAPKPYIGVEEIYDGSGNFCVNDGGKKIIEALVGNIAKVMTDHDARVSKKAIDEYKKAHNITD